MKFMQVLIVFLLIANLTATVWFGMKQKPTQNVNQNEKTAKHELPKTITPVIRKLILNEFVAAFNSADYEALYNLFGPVAKAQISKEQSDDEFKKLVKFMHSVERGAYTHSEFLDYRGNTTIYTMNYSVKLSDKCEFGTNGILKITIAVQGTEYQIYGIHLNAE